MAPLPQPPTRNSLAYRADAEWLINMAMRPFPHPMIGQRLPMRAHRLTRRGERWDGRSSMSRREVPDRLGKHRRTMKVVCNICQTGCAGNRGAIGVARLSNFHLLLHRSSRVLCTRETLPPSHLALGGDLSMLTAVWCRGRVFTNLH